MLSTTDEICGVDRPIPEEPFPAVSFNVASSEEELALIECDRESSSKATLQTRSILNPD